MHHAYQQESHLIFRLRLSCHCLPFKMYCLSFTIISFHSLFYIHFSLLIKVLTITIWSLVFHFVVFRLYSKLLKAVLLILKHATVLRQSKESKLALTEANLNYEKANIDSIIHQHFLECYPEDSKLVDFIMATEIGVFVFHFLQHFLIKLLVSSQLSWYCCVGPLPFLPCLFSHHFPFFFPFIPYLP